MLETMCHDVRVQQVSSLRRDRQICKFADVLPDVYTMLLRSCKETSIRREAVENGLGCGI